MNADQGKAKTIFLQAVEIASTEERLAYVARECGHDEVLRREVEDLLLHHQEMGSFLEAESRGPATLDEPAATERPGTVIGPYKLLQQIGEGGMGTVFMAEQTHPVRRKVALKLIKSGMDSRQVIARFEAERQALALMDHPNIAKVLDAGATESGRPYFVMELVKGVPITRYCDEHHLTPRQRVELFVPVCQAVQHAHHKGVIHRDMKPSNVMVCIYDGKPVPKVIDFGVAKATGAKLTERTCFTEFGAIVGTFEYMSPEQAELDQLDIDTRCDIYSLGVLLYELLTGTTPLERKRMKQVAILELLRLVREEEAPRPSVRVSTTEGLPSIAANRGTEPRRLSGVMRGELDWIVMKCLEKDRNRRYETANAFASDVLHYLHGEAVLACPPSATYKMRKFARRNRGPMLAVSVVLLALVGGIIGTTWGMVRAVRAQTRARAEEARAKQAEREMKEQADIAVAVNTFLQEDLLGQADIANQPLLLGGVHERNPNVTVRELLDRAALSIGGKFVGQAATEASIRLTIGETYRALARFREAEEHLEKSVQLRTAQLGDDHTDTLTSKNSLALLFKSQGQYARVAPLFEDLVQARTAKLGAGHRDTLSSKHDLATVYHALGRFDKAEPLFLEVVQASTATLGADDRRTLACKHDLAALYQDQVRFAEAESLLVEVVQGDIAKLGADHPNTLASKHDLAALYYYQGQYGKAEPLLTEVLQVFTAKLELDHPKTLTAKNGMAMLYMAQGLHAKAEPLLQQALVGARKKLGLAHPNTQSFLRNLAVCYEQMKAPERAEPLVCELLEFWKEKAGADSAPYAGQLINLGMNLLLQQRAADAATALRQGLAIRARKEPNLWSTFNTQSLLGEAFLDQKQFADAEPLLLEGYQGMQQREAKIPPQGKVRLTQALARLVRLYDALGEKDKAEEWRKKLAGATTPPKP
jgi:eukaryotic-like serine/threonine-protein kinase